MRTKTLLLTAALVAAGAASSMAQVYSVNAVGYINLTLNKGFTMMVNQLNASPNNAVGNVLGTTATVPFTVYLFNPSTGGYLINGYDGTGNYDDDAMVLTPGAGFWIKHNASSLTFTLVGEVPQGTLVTPLKQGFNLVGSQVPQSGGLGGQLGYTPSATPQGDAFYRYNNTGNPSTSGYLQYTYDPDAGYDPVDPPMNVGEALFAYRTQTGAGQTWTRTFTVN